MDLNIYSPDINLAGVIDQYSSIRWRRRFFEPGEFELHCKASAENCAMLQEENIIHRQDRKEAGIIEGIAIQTAQDGSGDEIVATGRMGSSMLERRIVTPTITFSGPAEDAVRKLVSDNAIANRPLPHLVLGSVAGLAPTAAFQVTWKTVLTAVEALGRAAPLGFRVRLDVPNNGFSRLMTVWIRRSRSTIGPMFCFQTNSAISPARPTPKTRPAIAILPMSAGREKISTG